MKKIKDLNKKGIRTAIFTVILLAVSTMSCNKFMDIPLTASQTAAEGAFISNATTSSVLSGVFYTMANSGAYSNLSEVETGLYTDELSNLSPASGYLPFYTDNLTNAIGSAFWNGLYQQVGACNVAIEGINNTTALLTNKNQYLGEAYVGRALSYFTLVNFFGGVPLAITSDYKVNNSLSRSTPAQVYAQIIADATTAVSLLPADFRDAIGTTITTSRARPNKYAAEALLARAYLYTGDWVNAEKWATDVINNTALFKLVPAAQTFIAAGNTELIWGLAPTGTSFVSDYTLYNNGMPASLPTGKTILSYNVTQSLSSGLMSIFEANDARYTNWVRVTLDPPNNQTYYYPNKYKSNVNGVENVVLFRLAEVYLIRAEARAQQNNVSGAQADINVIRTRAGLANTTAATQIDLLTAVTRERRVELFVEGNHRFFDLKRTGKIDAVMTPLALQKGGTWSSFKQLWPISPTDVVINTKLVQNPGY